SRSARPTAMTEVRDDLKERLRCSDVDLRKFLADDQRGGELSAPDHHILVAVMSNQREALARIEELEAELGWHIPFKRGDEVQTIKGAAFWGSVMAAYSLPGYDAFDPVGWRVDVLATSEGFKGTLHVYPALQLA